MLPNLLLVETCRRWPPGGLSHSQAACEPASRGGGVVTVSMKFHAIGDSSPTNALPKQEGLQLAEASFRDLMKETC